MAIELGSAKPDVQALYDLKPGHTGLRLPETLVRAQAMTPASYSSFTSTQNMAYGTHFFSEPLTFSSSRNNDGFFY